MRRSLYLIILLALISCKIHQKAESQVTPAIQIRNIIKEVKFLSLPYIFDANKSEELIIKHHVNAKGLDSLVFSESVLSIVGCLPDTTNYYAFLVAEPGDMFYPKFITYDKSGKRISKELISTCDCLTNPMVDVKSCYDSVIIKNNSTFYSISQLIATIQPYDSVKTEFDVSTSTKLLGRI